MLGRLFISYVVGLSSLLSCALYAQQHRSGNATDRSTDTPVPQAQVWSSLEPYFHPPQEWEGKYGSYRSPLTFEDGHRVQAPSEWPQRRAEIIARWHAMMGPWPELLERPELEILSSESRGELTQQRVRLEVASKTFQEGYLLKPNGKGPFPAVLVVFYDPETSAGVKADKPNRDFALQLARRGFVTLSIGTPGGNAWKPELGTAQCQPLSYHAYVAANCWTVLSQLPEVDAKRIGVVGHSYGGKWALFAAALFEPFACVAVSDPGIVFDETRSNVNYWEPWYLGKDPEFTRPSGIPDAQKPRTGAYKVMHEQGHDLHELHALIAPRPFLVSGGAEDPISRWEALNHRVDLDRLLGYTNRVGMTNRPLHDPNPESNALLVNFFIHFLQQVPPTF